MPETPESTQNTETQPPAGNVSELPQWARDAITKANNEAARYRTELRAKTDEHTAALSQIESLSGEKASAAEKAANAEKSLLKYTVAIGSGVPGEKAAEFASLLQGNDQTELKAHADTLLGLFGSSAKQTATDPSQGHGNGDSTSGLTDGGAFIRSAIGRR